MVRVPIIKSNKYALYGSVRKLIFMTLDEVFTRTIVFQEKDDFEMRMYVKKAQALTQGKFNELCGNLMLTTDKPRNHKKGERNKGFREGYKSFGIKNCLIKGTERHGYKRPKDGSTLGCF